MYKISKKLFIDFYNEEVDDYDLPDDMISFNWKEINEEAIKIIADHLDDLGIDVVEYETSSDFYALRFIKQEEK